jgi:hypothetical protein
MWEKAQMWEKAHLHPVAGKSKISNQTQAKQDYKKAHCNQAVNKRQKEDPVSCKR